MYIFLTTHVSTNHDTLPMKLQPQASASGPGNGSNVHDTHHSGWLFLCFRTLRWQALGYHPARGTSEKYCQNICLPKSGSLPLSSYRLRRRPVVIQFSLPSFRILGVLLGFCLSPCSIFFPTSWSSTVPHPVLASRNVFMPCATERLTPSWFRWSFRKLSSTPVYSLECSSSE